MRTLWKGSISFGLVNIPVKMGTATHDREFKFTLLHKKDLSEIKYQRICKSEDKVVPWDEIVKGYEIEKGKYVIFDEHDFEKANLKKTKTIDIIDFTDEKEVDPIYYMKPYYLEPDKAAEKTYALLRDVLVKSKKVGIAKYVIHNREHLALIKPYENAIIIIQLRYADEVVSVAGLDLPKSEKVSPKEMEIALQLVNQLTKSFDITDYKDTYTEEIKEMIREKAKGKKIQPKGKEPTPSKVHDIMSLLKASLEEPKKKDTKAVTKKATKSAAKNETKPKRLKKAS